MLWPVRSSPGWSMRVRRLRGSVLVKPPPLLRQPAPPVLLPVAQPDQVRCPDSESRCASPPQPA
ncbi:hypothetical protein HBB16_09890 [Pseudonocardia sp. MCCB 268]|nr:hypothetical protein [Pseudonocardia cytotoxica]